MKNVLALVTVLLLAGCSSMGTGDTQGPTDQSGKASSNDEAEKAIKSAPPELQEKIREQRAKSMNQGGPPPKSK